MAVDVTHSREIGRRREPKNDCMGKVWNKRNVRDPRDRSHRIVACSMAAACVQMEGSVSQTARTSTSTVDRPLTSSVFDDCDARCVNSLLARAHCVHLTHAACVCALLAALSSVGSLYSHNHSGAHVRVWSRKIPAACMDARMPATMTGRCCAHTMPGLYNWRAVTERGGPEPTERAQHPTAAFGRGTGATTAAPAQVPSH